MLYTTQFISGHGNFKAKLRGFNLVENDRCNHCGELETAHHVLMECLFYEEERREMRQILEEKGLNWEKRKFVRSKEISLKF